VKKALAADIDRLTAVEMLELWTDEVLKEGLGEPELPPWIRFKAKLDEYVWWIRTGGITILSGLALSIVTLFIGRRSAA